MGDLRRPEGRLPAPDGEDDRARHAVARLDAFQDFGMAGHELAPRLGGARHRALGEIVRTVLEFGLEVRLGDLGARTGEDEIGQVEIELCLPERILEDAARDAARLCLWPDLLIQEAMETGLKALAVRLCGRRRKGCREREDRRRSEERGEEDGDETKTSHERRHNGGRPKEPVFALQQRPWRRGPSHPFAMAIGCVS